MKRIIIGAIVFALFFRLILVANYHNSVWLMPSHFDSLGIGALIANLVNVEQLSFKFFTGKVVATSLIVYLALMELFNNSFDYFNTFQTIHYT